MRLEIVKRPYQAHAGEGEKAVVERGDNEMKIKLMGGGGKSSVWEVLKGED